MHVKLQCLLQQFALLPHFYWPLVPLWQERGLHIRAADVEGLLYSFQRQSTIGHATSIRQHVEGWRGSEEVIPWLLELGDKHLSKNSRLPSLRGLEMRSCRHHEGRRTNPSGEGMNLLEE